MTSSRLYLAGPMRGIPRYNFDSFAEARQRLRDRGFEILCPAERDLASGFDPIGMTGNEDLEALGFPVAQTLDQCFRDVLDCDGIALLPGWARSEGARAETLIAHLSGREIFEYHAHRPQILEPLADRAVLTRVEVLR